MAQAIGDWWGGLTEIKKGLSVIVATAMATAALTLSTLRFAGTPALAESNHDAITVVRDSVQVNARAVEALRMESRAQAARDEERFTRIVCYLKAIDEGTSAVGCN